MGRRKKTEETLTYSGRMEINFFSNEKLTFGIGLLLLGVAVWLTISFVSFLTTGSLDMSLIESPRDGEMLNEHRIFANTSGSMGAYTAYFFIKQCFGLAAFVIPVFVFMVAMKLMRVFNISIAKWFLCSALIMIWASLSLAKFVAPFVPGSHFNPGGDHGQYVCLWLENVVGTPGLTAVLAVLIIGFFSYASAETIYLIRRLLNPTKFITDRIKFKVVTGNESGDNTDSKDKDEEESKDEEEEKKGDAVIVELPLDNDEEERGEEEDKDKETKTEDEDMENKEAPTTEGGKDVTLEVTTAKNEDKAKGKSLVKVGDREMAPYDPKRDLENYRYPTLDLLKKYDNDGSPTVDMAEQNANKNRIVEVLRNFSVEISSIKATVGPTITLYEITPAQGVRISKIRNLEDDIALSLSALGIRIIAPIPGKGTIGIEVPNAKPNIVSMESILNSKKFQESTMELPCAIGKTITNEVFMFDLAKIPHLLVAGATGQGKSVGLNAIITSLLYKKHPAELKIVLIDPKKVEFSIYSPIANHFLAMVPETDDDAEPIITDVTKVVRTLNSLCKEMDTRYDLLKLAGARNIKEYNRKFIARQLNPENGHRYMPYIVVIIDEFGDLIMTAGKEIELPIARIAQLARAVGIHMVIATQRPTTTIITGNIKANFPGRIAFKVSAMIDSKTILDRPGANQLIGRGDMLFLNGNEPVRVQCAFVDTPEVERINEFISRQQGYTSPFELPEPDTDNGEAGGGKDVDMHHIDPLFKEAARAIVLSDSGSTSLIQRKFSIGYNRAGRIMDQLEQAGIVGVAPGSGKPREVLIRDLSSLESLLNQYKD